MQLCSVDYRRDLTVRWEIRRAVSTGLMETAMQSLFLLIAIRHFNAGPTEKALISSAGSIGYLLSPIVVVGAQLVSLNATRSAALLHVLGGAALLSSLLSPAFGAYLFGAIAAPALCVSTVPFLSQVYNENYPREERGRLVARSTFTRILVSGVGAAFFGALLTGNIEVYPAYIFTLIISIFVASYALSQIPSDDGSLPRHPHVLVGFSALATEPSFRANLCAWFLFGLATFVTAPVRTELVTDPRFGFALSEYQVALIIVTIPSIGRLLTTKLWGRLVDTRNSATILSLLFGIASLSIVLFFSATSITALVVASLLQGAAVSGSELCWVLWITGSAKSDRVASYTAVYTFFLGIRGVAGSLIGFHILEESTPAAVAAVGIAFMAASGTSFYHEINRSKRAR